MNSFVLFGFQHIGIMIVGAIGVFLMLFLANINYKIFPKALGITILILKLAELGYRHIIAGEPIHSMLPLHLCNLTIIFAILVIAFRVDFFFSIVYYWSIGAIFAILTPDVTRSLPYFPTFSFFITHFFILFAPLCCIMIFNMRPTLKDYWSAFILLNVCAFIIFFINRKLGTNYLFINRIPEFASPLKLLYKLPKPYDRIANWPYYILVIEGLYLFITYLMYLPFKRKKTQFIPKK